jgi:orotate phosphoribosyltransferase
MIFSPTDAAHTAQALVATGAVRLAGSTPFFYTSGWASPVYVDVHALLSDVQHRAAILERLVQSVAPLVRSRGIGAIVGTESSGIALAAWLADRLGLPMLTLRKRPIGWGMQAQLQGRLAESCKVLLVDDVTTDGRSKNAAAAALRQTGAEVADVLVLFDYAIYPQVPPLAPPLALHALASWEHLHAALKADGRLAEADRRTLADFSAAPIDWSVAHGGTGAPA